MTDEGLPHKGTMRISYNTEPKCAVAKLRSALGKFCIVGKVTVLNLPRVAPTSITSSRRSLDVCEKN